MCLKIHMDDLFKYSTAILVDWIKISPNRIVSKLFSKYNLDILIWKAGRGDIIYTINTSKKNIKGTYQKKIYIYI
jgi:hypothetical protein